MTRRIICCIYILACLPLLKATAQSARSDQLYGQGIALYNQGRYQEAISFFAQTEALDQQEIPANSSRRAYATLWIASCYYRLGNEEKARELDPVSYAFPPVDRRLTVRSDSIYDLAQERIGQGDYEGALPLLQACARLEREALGDNSLWLANSLCQTADCMFAAGHDPAEALQALDEPQEIYTHNGMHKGMADAYYLRANIYTNIGDIDEAIRYFRASSAEYVKAKDELNVQFALLGIASCYNFNDNFKEGLQMALQAADNIARMPHAGKDSYAYARAMGTAALSCSNQDNTEDAYKYSKEAKRAYETQGDTVSYDYFHNKLCYTLSAAKLEEPEAPLLVKDMKNTLEALGWERNPDYAYLLQFYFRHNIAEMSKEEIMDMIREIMDIYATTTGKSSTQYLNALYDVVDIAFEFVMKSEGIDLIWQYLTEAEQETLANRELDSWYKVRLYDQLGIFACNFYNRFDEGIEYYRKGKRIAEANRITETPIYCQLLSNLGQAYSNSGKNEEALQTYLLEKSIYDNSSLHKDYNYIMLLSNICQHYIHVGDFAKANQIQSLAQAEHDSIVVLDNSAWFMLATNDVIASIRTNTPDEVIDQKIAKLHELSQGVTTMQNLYNSYMGAIIAVCYFKANRYQEAQDYMERAIDDMQTMFASQSFMIIPYQGLLAYLYLQNKQYAKALACINMAIQNYQAHPDTNPMILAQLLYIHLEAKKAVGRKDTTQDAASITRILADEVSNNFRYMTYRERSLFWEQYSGWFTYDLPQLLQGNCDAGLLPVAYNSMLLSKGLLLNSEVEIGNLIAEKGDAAAQKLYNDIQVSRSQLAKLAQSTGNAAAYEQLNQQIQHLERQLMQTSKEYGDYTQKLTITWTDVRQHLKPGEVAIEFIEIPDYQAGSSYIALVIGPEYDRPYRIALCQDAQIDSIPPQELYNTSRLWNLIWKPLDHELRGAKRIYFSPAGRLYSTAIEYAALPDGDVMNNRYEIYRLSSTREVALQTNADGKQSAVVYGGLEFDADYQTLAEVDDEQKELDIFRPRALVSQLEGLRGGVVDLPGTEKEAEDIVRIFNESRQQCHLFNGLNGTEESFKRLSGTRETIMHIATHGFYWNGDEKAPPTLNLSGLLQMGNIPTVPAEDKMLSRNGLLFAGANTALRNGQVPDGRDDGILTARELSGLDFRGVDLVVLSACQSGLGEVTGEGVFGLQRGFKKAGAQTLMMSLWKVDDQATQLLMTEFYRNLLAGKSKRTAFNDAQQYLKKADNGRYKSPRYWAAFIMLDGIR